MAGGVDDWRLLEKRRSIVQKLEEAYPVGKQLQQTPQELEQTVYDKSKTREEYNHYIHQVVVMLARGRRAGGVQPNSSAPMMNNPGYQQSQFGQYNMPGEPPGYTPHNMYQRPPMRQPQPYNPMQRMPSQQPGYPMPGGPGGYGASPRYPGMNPSIMNNPIRGPVVGGMTQRPSNPPGGMGGVPSSGGFIHSVQSVSNPSYTTGPYQPPAQTGVPTTAPASDKMNPPTPHQIQSVPSPAPPTPLLPASPAPSGVGSPAQQSSMTPEENETYMRKLGELQKYIPLLQKWIAKLSKEDRNNQLPKLKQLYSLLASSSKRVPINTLMRCGEALDKMFQGDQSSRDSLDKTTPSISTPQNEPVVPATKIQEPRHSPSLLEFKMLPSPPASVIGAVHTRPLPSERLPPAKRMCNRDEPKIPYSLMREAATLPNVRVKHLPNESSYDKSTLLECRLEDEGLSPVPPLKIKIPSNYPLVSPICDFSHYKGEGLVEEVGQQLTNRLSRSYQTYSLSSLLADWESCVLSAMANQLSAIELS